MAGRTAYQQVHRTVTRSCNFEELSIHDSDSDKECEDVFRTQVSPLPFVQQLSPFIPHRQQRRFPHNFPQVSASPSASCRSTPTQSPLVHRREGNHNNRRSNNDSHFHDSFHAAQFFSPVTHRRQKDSSQSGHGSAIASQWGHGPSMMSQSSMTDSLTSDDGRMSPCTFMPAHNHQRTTVPEQMPAPPRLSTTRHPTSHPHMSTYLQHYSHSRHGDVMPWFYRLDLRSPTENNDRNYNNVE